MLKGFIAALFLTLLFGLSAASLSQAGPGHGFEEEGAKVEKNAKQELRSVIKVLRQESKRSRAVWQRSVIQEPWRVDKLCIRDTFLSLDEQGPITDVQSLYTISALRAISLHTLGPDGQRHTSFKGALAKLRSLRVKNKGLARVVKNKIDYMKATAALPRYQSSLCPLLSNWQAAGRPDLFSYAKLDRHTRSIANFNRANRKGLPGAAYAAIYSLFPVKSDEDWLRLDRFINWFSSTLPYLEGFRANTAAWKFWSGENYPRSGLLTKAGA